MNDGQEVDAVKAIKPGRLSVVCTEAASLNLSVNGTRGAVGQQKGSPQKQAACRSRVVPSRGLWQAGDGDGEKATAGWPRARSQYALGRRSPWRWTAKGGRADVLEKLWVRVEVRSWLNLCSKGGQTPASRAVGPGVQPERRGEGVCLLVARLQLLLQSKVQPGAPPEQWVSGAWSKRGWGPRAPGVLWEVQRWDGLWPGMGLGHLGQSAAVTWPSRRVQGLGFRTHQKGTRTQLGKGNNATRQRRHICSPGQGWPGKVAQRVCGISIVGKSLLLLAWLWHGHFTRWPPKVFSDINNFMTLWLSLSSREHQFL